MPRPIQDKSAGSRFGPRSDPKGEIHGRISSIGDEKIVTTIGTSGSGKAMGQDAAFEILAEILLDVGGNRGTLIIRVPTAGPGLCKGAHVRQIGSRESLHVRECRTQVVGKPFDDLGAPALFRLPDQNIPPDLPIEQPQFAVDDQRGTLLGGMDAVFQLHQPVGVTDRLRRQGNGAVAHALPPNAAISSCFRAFCATSSWRPIS